MRGTLCFVHCRNLGHSVHTCSKLNVDTSVTAPKKTQNVNTKDQLEKDVNHKKNHETPIHKTTQTGSKAVGKKLVYTHNQPGIPAPILEPIIDVEDGELPQDTVTTLFASDATLVT